MLLANLVVNAHDDTAGMDRLASLCGLRLWGSAIAPRT